MYVYLCRFLKIIYIQSSQLLYILLYHLEDHVTQHLQSVLSGLYHSAQDEEQVVVKQVGVLLDLEFHFCLANVISDNAVFRIDWVLH